jgi:hypothetical protein
VRSPWREQGRRPNWLPAAVLTLAGVVVTAAGRPMTSQYAQGVLLNLGTALLLFAVLAFAEPWLLSPLRRPRTIAEAQERLRPFVSSDTVPDGRVGSVSAEVRAATDRVRQLLRDAGFWIAHTRPGDERMTFVDWRHGADHPREPSNDRAAQVEWTVTWAGGVLGHEVKIDGVRRTGWTSKRLGDEVTAATRAEIDRFAQQEVYRIMCWLVDLVERGRPR